MNRFARLFAPASALLYSLVSASGLHAQFTAPTPAELSMTSIPQVPNAPAVFLFKEETTEDALRMHSFYVRLKVLTEGGKEYANVELPYYAGTRGSSIDSIAGRTIQPDGTIVAFTGKPYEKLIEKGQGNAVKSKVFTLPAVQVGSILEYRYKIRYDDAYLQSPQWYIQSDLYTQKAHYDWKPTSETVVSTDDRGGEIQSSIAWTPLLPPGAEVKQTAILGAKSSNGGNQAGGTKIDLVVQDIPPLPHESFMPPINSLSYRVLFYYTSYRTAQEYWDRDGKRWSKQRDKFIGPGNGVRAATAALIAPGDNDDQKLHKIYSAVMELENTDFTRSHNSDENKAQGLKEVSNTDDILSRKRGSGDQLACLFVAMVRAAGMKGYLMGVADRKDRIFIPAYLSTSQLDDDIAIVSVGGKDVYFDPGQRYCAFEHLAWQHALTNGLRQTDNGVALASTPAELYSASSTKRIADLTLDDHGEATGTVTITYAGAPALRWRQEALRGDERSLHNELRSNLEHRMPGGMDIKVDTVANLEDFSQPLVVKFEVKGAIGSPTGKRLLIPASLFEANARPEFTAATRELVVDMHYPEVTQDAVRIKYPASFVVESAPPATDGKMGGVAVFNLATKSGTNSITLFRNVTIGRTFFPPTDYPDLKGFYSKLDAGQAETLILTRPDGSTPKTAGGN